MPPTGGNGVAQHRDLGMRVEAIAKNKHAGILGVHTRQNLSARPPNQKLSNAGRRAFDGSGRPTGRVWKCDEGAKTIAVCL